MSTKQEFKEHWIRSLLKNMGEGMRREEAVKLLEACGRDCARRSTVLAKAEASRGDLDGFLKQLGQYIGADHAVREGDRVRIIYPSCYCPMVSQGPDTLPPLYCNCSRGWLLEIFAVVTGEAVQVELEKSIKRGDPRCEFLITL